MSNQALISMLFILGTVIGGFMYFAFKAVQLEKKKKQEDSE